MKAFWMLLVLNIIAWKVPEKEHVTEPENQFQTLAFAS